MTVFEATKMKLAGVEAKFWAQADPLTGDLTLTLKLGRRAGKEGADVAVGDRSARGGALRP